MIEYIFWLHAQRATSASVDPLVDALVFGLFHGVLCATSLPRSISITFKTFPVKDLFTKLYSCTKTLLW